jgi:hypothetical protein
MSTTPFMNTASTAQARSAFQPSASLRTSLDSQLPSSPLARLGSCSTGAASRGKDAAAGEGASGRAADGKTPSGRDAAAGSAQGDALAQLAAVAALLNGPEQDVKPEEHASNGYSADGGAANGLRGASQSLAAAGPGGLGDLSFPRPSSRHAIPPLPSLGEAGSLGSLLSGQQTSLLLGTSSLLQSLDSQRREGKRGGRGAGQRGGRAAKRRRRRSSDDDGTESDDSDLGAGGEDGDADGDEGGPGQRRSLTERFQVGGRSTV